MDCSRNNGIFVCTCQFNPFFLGKKERLAVIGVCKPEWIFLIVLYLCDANPENRIPVQYLPGRSMPIVKM